MENGVVIYLEDTEHGIKIIGKIVRKPEQSKELADEIMLELIGDCDPYVPSALQ